MEIVNLSNTSFDDLLDCFLVAFENYYVKMPTDKNYYKKRWAAAKVDFRYSYGMYDKGQLIGFIIHAIDHRFGKYTAFNTGTGVIPRYRGKRIVKSIYEFAFDDLRQHGIEKASLEVITENTPAIKSYESVGFNICKNYKCFAGEIRFEEQDDIAIEETIFDKIDWSKLPNQQFYSWDFQKESLSAVANKYYQVIYNGKVASYFIINQESQYLSQFDLFDEDDLSWKRLFSGIKKIAPSIKIINLDDRHKSKIHFLQSIGMKNTINQYEMELNFT